MKILYMRWGYDGGGMACGPVEGSAIVEIMVREDNGTTAFVTASRMEDAENIYTSELPLFDVIMSLASSESNFEPELAKVNKAAEARFSHMIYHMPETAKFNRFYDVMRLARVALNGADLEALGSDAKAKVFIAPYLGKEIGDLEIPDDTIECEDGEDEDYEYEISHRDVEMYLKECEAEEHSGEIKAHYWVCDDSGEEITDGEVTVTITQEQLEAYQKARRKANEEHNDGGFWSVDLADVPGCESVNEEALSKVYNDSCFDSEESENYQVSVSL